MKNGIHFLTQNGRRVDDLRNFISTWLQEHPNGKVNVGCDSKTRGEFTKYSTVICLWDVGHGVWEVYQNEVVKRPKDRFSRLWDEVVRSVDVANRISDIVEDVTVHMDFNSNPNYPSYQLYDAGMGYVKSMGYEAVGKPDSWAASCSADRHSK